MELMRSTVQKAPAWLMRSFVIYLIQGCVADAWLQKQFLGSASWAACVPSDTKHAWPTSMHGEQSSCMSNKHGRMHGEQSSSTANYCEQGLEERLTIVSQPSLTIVEESLTI
eukprot:1153086-Pelagomonas_calceolata.AAC.8